MGQMPTDSGAVSSAAFCSGSGEVGHLSAAGDYASEILLDMEEKVVQVDGSTELAVSCGRQLAAISGPSTANSGPPAVEPTSRGCRVRTMLLYKVINVPDG